MRLPVRPAPRALRALSVTIAALGLMAFGASASVAAPPAADPDGPTWVADLSVQAFARDGQTLYIGGDFTRLSPRTGATIVLDGNDARQSTPEVNGDIRDSARDSNGGFYIVGSFTAVGGAPRPGVAHLLPDGSLDTAFSPPAITGSIQSIAVSGSAVYIGGTVSGVGGTFRNNIAALNPTTGALLPFSQGVSGYSDAITTMLVSGTTLYAGGSFSDSSGNNGIGMLAAYDTAAAGGAGAIKPAFVPEPNQTVNALYLETGTNTLYLGGGFGCLPDLNDNQGCDGGGELVRRNIAAVDATTGAVKAFNASVSLSGPNFSSVQTIGRDTNALVFGGDFNCVGATNNDDEDCNDGGEFARQNLVRVNLTTGAPDGWQPNPNETVRALDKTNASWLIGGDFTTIGGQPRSHLARVGEDNAAPVGALDVAPDAAVHTIVRRNDPSRVLIGGDFRGAGGVKRAGLAAIDLQSGQPTSWAPSAAGGLVRALAVSGSTVYVGGIFVTLGGQPRTHLGAVDAASGTVTAWAPQPNGSVDALVPLGGSVYAGGSFATVGGTPAPGLARIDAASGAAQAGFPGTVGAVSALAVQGSTLYVGGGFGQLGGQLRSNAGAVNLDTGTVTGWNPHTNSPVAALASTPGRVFLGGAFTTLNNGASNRTAVGAVDPTTGTALAGWDAHAQSVQVNALSLDGDDLYLGLSGQTLIAGTNVRGLASVAAADGAVRTGWVPQFASGVNAVSAQNGTIAAGGYFHAVDTTGQAGLATFTPAPVNVNAPSIDGTPAIGSTLTCAAGTWNGNPLLTRAWLRDGAPIPGATADTYTPVPADGGQAVACRVTASNLRGSASVTSASVNVAVVPVVPVVPGNGARVTLAAALGKTVKKASADTVVVTYPSNVTLKGATWTAEGLPEGKVAVTTSRRFESSVISSTLGKLTSDTKGAFSTTVKKPLRNARYTATAATGSASVLVRVAPALSSTTKKRQRGGKVTLAGTIRLPTLKKAGSLRVERKAGKAYRKVKTIPSFTKGRFSLKTAQKKGTTTYRVRFVPRSAKTYTAASLTIKVKRS